MRVKPIEEARKGVMRGNAVWQFKKRREPFLFCMTKFLHILPAISTADDGTDSNSNDVNEQVTLAAVDPRVSQFGKVGEKRASP